MDKKRSSLFSSLFPWTSPFVIKFAIVKGGIEVQLFRNNRQITRWHASKLRRSLPEPLLKWIEDNHLTTGAQPYPLVKQLWHALLPLASKKLLIDVSELIPLQETSQPFDFAMNWRLNQNLACIEGSYNGADNYLGMGWFQKGHVVWPLRQPFPQAAAFYFENQSVPLEQAGTLLSTVIPALQPYFAARADFQLITDFAVDIVVQNAQSGRLALALESNYPQLLFTLSIPQQKTDFFLAQQALIQFPRQALTPVLMHLLQGKGAPVSLQEEDVPLFIKEQLLTMRQYHQISDDMAKKITQANPIVSIASLKPDFSFPIHTMENGIGKYSTAATYQYQNHTLNMHELLNRHKRQQRFINQFGTWFEWPENSQHLAQTIQQTLVPRVLLPVELMGLVSRQQDLLQKGLLQIKPHAYTIQPEGTTPLARAQSLFQQLQYHGVPGGVFGDPAGLANMLLGACEKLVRDNRHARILWLTTSNKKGAVTRALNASNLPMHAVTVASPVTLRDEPGLFLQSWTLVIFHGLDQLQLDRSAETWRLPQLKWNWALLTASSQYTLNPFSMQILHLPEQYSRQFSERFLFDPTRSYAKPPTGQGTAGLQSAPAARTLDVKPAPMAPPVQAQKAAAPQRIAPAASTASHFSTHEITITSKTPPLPPATPSEPRAQASQSMDQMAQKAEPVVNQPPMRPQASSLTNTEARPAASAGRPTIELNPTKIAQLHEESEYLQERLTVEETAPSLPAIQVPLPSPVQPVPAVEQEPPVTQQSAMPEQVSKESAAPSRTNPLEDVEAQTNEKGHGAETTMADSRPAKQARQMTPANHVALVEQRIALMKRYWQVFDEIHARQAEGMPPLREGQILNPLSIGFEHYYRFDRPDPLPRYQQLLPATVRTEIEQLWGTVMIPKWPERIISEPFPHKLFTEAFGVTLNFWHSCSLNAWFFCEYILSFSDLGDLAEFYREQIQELKNMGTPINIQLFDDLSKAGRQLGEPQVSSTSWAAHRKGFEKVRDVISTYRRQWANTYLDKYLQKRWEGEIHEASLSYSFATSDKGTPPTVKRLAKEAKNAINRWFGGDISVLYTAIGKPSPLRPQRMVVLPQDRDAFASAFLEELRTHEGLKSHRTGSALYNLNKLAEYSFRYIQLEEALGSVPTLSDFDANKFAKYSTVLNREIDKAWAIFSNAIAHAKRIMPGSVITAGPTIRPESNQLLASEQQAVKTGYETMKPALMHAPVQLDQEAISKLQEESDYLQERLMVEEEDRLASPGVQAEFVSHEAAGAALELAEAVSTTSAEDRKAPEVDEDWQIIYPQWHAEHWEILRLLCQAQIIQFTVEERKSRRPISRLIDEINLPVDEQLNDLLIDAETQTLALHLRPTVEHLVRWYYSLEGR